MKSAPVNPRSPLKMLLLEGARQAALEAGLQNNSGILADTTFGQQALNDVTGGDGGLADRLRCPVRIR